MEAVKGAEATAEAVVVAATVAVARAEEVTGVEKEVVVMVRWLLEPGCDHVDPCAHASTRPDAGLVSVDGNEARLTAGLK